MKPICLLFVCLLLVSSMACKSDKNSSKHTDVSTNQSAKTEAPDVRVFGMMEDDVPVGLKKGDRAPDVFLPIDGKEVRLADLYKDQTLALFFYRGNWCPACNKHLSEFTERVRDLTAKGIRLIAVTPESIEGIEAMREKTGATFTIVSDGSGAIQKAFDVDFLVTQEYVDKIEEGLRASIADNNASKVAELPVPATYVINRTGEIIFGHFDVDYKNRASIDDILNSVPN